MVVSPPYPPRKTLQKRLAPLEGLADEALLLHEVYASIQGESSYVGVPCTFVRTTACHLRCRWCDTPHAFSAGERWSMADVLDEVGRLGPRMVEITGGEPLLQPAVLPLMSRLCDAGYLVLLETSGALDLAPVDPRVVRIVDFKAPSSGEVAANRIENVELLTERDEAKLVIGDRTDYEWARSFIDDHRLAERCIVLLGTVFGVLPERELAAWILADDLPVRMQLQAHKYIWEPDRRGV